MLLIFVMSDPKRTIILLATYNEMENLPDLIQAIRTRVPAADILVVDDQSPDGTGVWVDQAQKNDEHLFCIHRSGKLGLGTAVITALLYARDHHYDYAVNMDADFSHPVDKIPELLAAMDATPEAPVDVAIGSRYVSGGGVKGWPFMRRCMSRCINLYARLLLGLCTKDNSGSFRCYRLECIKQIDFSRFRSSGYSFFEEILYRLKNKGARFVEIPILFIDRTRGSSKINKREAFHALRIIFELGFKKEKHS